MTQAFRPGDPIPESGIYWVKHEPSHAPEHAVTCIYGSKFPPCRECNHPQFKLVHSATHIKNHEFFRSPITSL